MVNSFNLDSSASTEIEQYAAFVEHCAHLKPRIASVVLDAFAACYGINQDSKNVHGVVVEHNLDTPGAMRVIRAFFSLWNEPSAQTHYLCPIKDNERKLPALLSAYNNTGGGMVALFGGQNGDPIVYMEEAKWMLDTYYPLLADFTKAMSLFLDSASKDSGSPPDIIKQVDPYTLYLVVAAAEALVRSGFSDPYELYKHFHVSEVGNSLGSAIGGCVSYSKTFRERMFEKDLRNDCCQELLLSTAQAWVNMLLLSGAGPVLPVVGACATGVLSINVASEAIQSGKAKVMLAGSVDDLHEDIMYEFANMGALCNNVEDSANGRTPREACRPCTSTRMGLLESHGAGVVVLMSAAAAIECGAPIYGIVGMSELASDKQGHSVPAPGQGILNFAQESRLSVDNSSSLRVLDIGYRRQQLKRQLKILDAMEKSEMESASETPAKHGTEDNGVVSQIKQEYALQRKYVRDVWSNGFWADNRSNISPIRGNLSVWGLNIDDIGVAYFHGTSTPANDKNESDVVNAQMRHLGRTPGNMVPVVSQKWLTGHPKGPAAMFMLNSVLQSLRTDIIPGNRNADNIDSELREYEYMLYLSKSVQTSGIKAAMLTSFGFGQVGGELLIVHPDYLFAALTHSELEEYNSKMVARNSKSYRYWQDTLVGNHSFVQAKDRPPSSPYIEKQIYLDPTARAQLNPLTRSYESSL
ncbi:fatty acid synthase alpha subunit Lsd1 [Coemansia sp. RSA 1200]|nr:fatty acid synthase alpha subunit Lsd1 [Coemansia sp. RSA 1200]